MPGPMLDNLKTIGKIYPSFGDFLDRTLADNYDDFVKVLYKDIDNIIFSIEENPEHVQDDSEDRLTIEIRRSLKHMGYSATHDEKCGGHTDLLVRKGTFVWIGEAKIHKDYAWLLKGFQQLCTRYSTGDSNQRNGGIIIYIFVENAKSVMDKWKEHLSNQDIPEFKTDICNKREISFISTHCHTRSGLPFIVRHMPVILSFKPKDSA